MKSPLQRKQIFALQCFAKLVVFAEQRGLNLVAGEAWRSDATAAIYAAAGKGIKESLHRLRLAWDIALIDDNGQIMPKSESYAELGEYWKTLNAGGYMCRWGGDFLVKPDGNHFSVEHNGIK
jgi:hypothetical protein